MRGLFFLFLFAFSSPVLAHQIVLTPQAAGDSSSAAFVCGQRIYAHIYWSRLPTGPHELVAFWRRPDGRVQEQTEHRWSGPLYRTTVWLDVRPPVFASLLAVDHPSHGRWS